MAKKRVYNHRLTRSSYPDEELNIFITTFSVRSRVCLTFETVWRFRDRPKISLCRFYSKGCFAAIFFFYCHWPFSWFFGMNHSLALLKLSSLLKSWSSSEFFPPTISSDISSWQTVWSIHLFCSFFILFRDYLLSKSILKFLHLLFDWLISFGILLFCRGKPLNSNSNFGLNWVFGIHRKIIIFEINFYYDKTVTSTLNC